MGRDALWRASRGSKQQGKVVTLFSADGAPFCVSASSVFVFVRTNTRAAPPFGRAFAPAGRDLHLMQETLHVVQEIAPNATLGEHTVWYKWVCIIVQMGDAHYQHLGDALSYKWDAHYYPN